MNIILDTKPSIKKIYLIGINVDKNENEKYEIKLGKCIHHDIKSAKKIVNKFNKIYKKYNIKNVN